jgi:ABC-type branched-subunit amino acid transport system ATPase component
MPEPAAACLEIRGLTKRFGGFYALNQLDLDIAAGHIHALIGPNGAGKTTFFNLLTGVLAADEGGIVFEGRPLDEARPSRRTGRGIARTFQNIRLFPHLARDRDDRRALPRLWIDLEGAGRGGAAAPIRRGG